MARIPLCSKVAVWFSIYFERCPGVFAGALAELSRSVTGLSGALPVLRESAQRKRRLLREAGRLPGPASAAEPEK